MMYLPENQQQWWIDMLRVWELGVDADPEIENRIEFHNPNGKTYIARAFGTETIFGKTVQRGIAARVLEYANQLLVLAYETTDGPDINNDGQPDWYIPVVEDGMPIVKWDPSIAALDVDGRTQPAGRDGCNEVDSSDCTCDANRACLELQKYVQIPYFLRQTMDAYGLSGFRQRGIY